LTGLILILLPCLGLGGGVVYLRRWNAGALSRWRRLEPLPARGIELVAGTTTTVYVRAEDGGLYGCRHRGGIEVRRDCWFVAREPLDADLDHQSEERLYPGDVELPSGTIVDSLEVTVRYAESMSETRYLLMQDGAVFKWEYDRSMFGNLGKLVLGALAGLVVGIAVVVLLWARRGLQGRRGRSER
jgi:hypothetical protein